MSDDPHEPSRGVHPDGEPVDGWPVQLGGVTETVIATAGPNGRWNQAALGVAPPEDGPDALEVGTGTPASARTFGRTRTRRNFAEGRAAYVQCTRDPLDFVEAALGVYETDAPILASADAWTRIDATEETRSDDRGTEIVEWSLRPIDAAVRDRVVPTTNRGRAAAIEATVPASRLDVEGYDDEALLDRLQWLAGIVETTGDEQSRVAFERIAEHVDWRKRLE